MHDDADRWNDRYRTASPSTALAPEPLAERADLAEFVPTAGQAIDIACGLGAQSLWLARRGLHVVALDVSPVAVDLLTAAAADAGLSRLIDARVTDLDDGLPSEPAAADVIVCQRFRQPALYAPIARRLTAGGIAIVTVLSQAGADAPGPFHAPPGELVSAFADLDLLYASEGDGVATIVARRN